MVTLISGIDEAGRGSVFGPLVIVGLSLDQSVLKKLQKKGLKDSKLFNGPSGEKIRSKLAIEIQEKVEEMHVKEISPSEIDETLSNRPRDNLNLLEIRYFYSILMNLESTEVIVDTLSSPKYTMNQLKILMDTSDNKIHSKIHMFEDNQIKYSLIRNKKIFKNLVISTKADRFFPVVSAASCVAKHIRDLKLRDIEEKWNLPNLSLGKGYPNANDPHVMSFLEGNSERIKKREFDFIRYNWNWDPLKRILNSPEKKLDQFFN